VSNLVRWLRYGTAFGLSLFVLLGLSGLPGMLGARADDRTKQIAEIEKKLAELKNKLAELKKTDAPGERKPLELKDALDWRNLGRALLSRDGQWFAYGVMQAEGKGEVVVRQTRGDKEHRFPGSSFNIAFSHDSRWLAFAAMPPTQAGRRGPRAAAPPVRAAQEKPKVVLLELGTGKKVEYEGLTRFAFAGEASNVLALHKPGARPLTVGPPAPGATPSASDSGRGSDLVLRELATGKELTLGNVAEFAFDKKGDWLALVIDSQGQVGNGVQLRNMKTAALHQLDSGKASYQGLRWTEKGDAFSLLKGIEDKAFKDKLYSVLAFTNIGAAEPTRIAYDPARDSAFPKGMAISAARTPSLAEDLGALFFGIHEPRKADTPARTIAKADPTKGKTDAPKGKGKRPALAGAKASEEKPDLVIWHWNDERLQSHQEKQATSDRMYSYLCTYRVKEKKFLRLADDSLRQVDVAPKQRWAIGLDDRSTRRSRWLDGRGLQDVYVIDLQTGQRHLALKGNRSFFFGPLGVVPSPDGARFLYYDAGQFFAYDMAAKTSRCISKGAATSFIDTENDRPVDRPPTRVLGWSKDSSAVLISDNWDVWKLPVAEGPAVNLTGNGKKEGIRYRGRIVLDSEEKGADLSAPLYFSAMGEWTKKSGFVRIDPKTGSTRLLWGDTEFGGLMKAKDADVFVYSRETTAEYPDYHATDSTFKPSRRLTTVNPQQEKFLWAPGSMLVNYESTKGDRLQGALLLPANYQKGKKYPTVVYIYERLSQMKNRYLHPRGWGFSPALYTSNGYAVLLPDIKYRVNDPGMSAVWCVLPALDAAIATGVVDRDRVGLHGHSWGGYQTAFLITQTQAFRAAVAGAPLTNMVSMYSSIYWNIGIPNQPIFESSQGRFTDGYWDLMEAYIRNSPVFHAKNVKTPLILLHNDKDGAVDFNQGVEYFNTLRRLNKPVVMLQYKGENHGLAKPANQKDYSRRMREFFDHHLQGKPAPGWLKDGVPHLKMEEHLKERAKEK
jgi:dipeptidyl aminopeptidase/acylaminoacyl peptidase